MIEMAISITIFAVMSMAVISIYIQTTAVWQKLRMTRHLSESAREITERIADDVRTGGISLLWSSYDDHTVGNDLWKSPDYTSHGGEILGIGNETTVKKRYVFWKINNTSHLVERCLDADKKNPQIHCWLYNIDGTSWWEPFNLIDTFIPEEDKKRVKVEDLKFYISWDGVTTEKKVTLVFTLALMPRVWIPGWLISDTKLHIQTTVSERFFRDIQ